MNLLFINQGQRSLESASATLGKIMNCVFGTNVVKGLISLMLLWCALSVPSVMAKDLPGSAQTSYGVSASGALQFQIPIVIPQGINGVQPNLSLSFSSSRSNGMAGVGWGVSGLGEISRCGRTIVRDGVNVGPQHGADDRFCLNGQPLILSKGSVYGANATEYRTELETFSKVVAYGTSTNVNGGQAPTWFRVWRKNGRFEDYGRDGDGRYKLPGTNSIHSWKQTRVYDRNLNYYRVKYLASTGLPDRIEYTLNDTYSSGVDAVVTFGYQVRPDKRTSYVAGSRIVNQHRLLHIGVHKGGLMRKYNLAYETAPTSGRSRLKTITEIGMNNQAMPPIAIQWKGTTNGFVTGPAKDRAPDDLIEYYSYNQQSGTSGTTYPRVKQLNRGQWADMNGDGMADLVIAYTSPGGTKVLKTYLKTPGTSSGWTESSKHRLPDTLRSYRNSIVNVHPARFKSSVINKGQLVDVNGDGLADLVISYRVNKQRHQYNSNPAADKDIESVQMTYINKNGSWQESNSSSKYKPRDYIYDYTGPVFGSTAVETTRGRFVDINGDGLVDWLTSYRYRQGAASLSRRHTWLNNGTTWVLNTTYAPPSYFKEWYGTHSWERGELVDVNGDGRLDWVEAYQSLWDGVVTNTWLNTGSGWNKDNSYNLPEPIYHNNGSTGFAVRRGSFIDLNGDGLRDWVRSHRVINTNNLQQATLLNKGKGWVASSAYKPPFIHQDYLYIDKTGANGTEATGQSWPVQTRGFYVDVNRDGLVDFVQSYRDVSNATKKSTWLNTGAGWGSAQTSGVYVAQDLHFDYGGRRDQGKSNFGQFIDINSDTGPDWVTARKGVTRLTRLNRVGSADWVDRMITTMGVVVKPEFLPLTANDDIYKKYPTNDGGGVIPALADSVYIESPIYVVSKLHSSRADGDGFNTQSFHYAGLQINRKGRGNLGFKQRTVVDVNKDITSFTQYRQDFPYIGQVDRSGTMAGNQDLSTSVVSYNKKTLTHAGGRKTYFPYSSTALSYTRELGTSTKLTRDESRTFTYDDYGNVEVQRVIIKNDAGTVESDVRTTNTYKITPSNWLISSVETSAARSAKPGYPTITNNSSYIYDGRGRVTYMMREPQGSAEVKLTTSYNYDVHGNIEKETQTSAAGTRVNTISYDAKKRLPLTIKNAKDHQSVIETYHPQCDQPTKIRDANGLATRFEYDNFCRQDKETSPENIVSAINYSVNVRQVKCLAGSSSCSDRLVKFSTTTTTTGQTPVSVNYNRHNQATSSSTTGMLGETIRQRTEYDRFGRTARESQPFFDNGTEFYTNYTYDVLDRLRTTTLAFTNDSGGAARVVRSYGVTSTGQRQLSVTDTKGRVTKSIANSLGQIVRVIDANSKSLLYYFDSQGNLARTRDTAGHEITVGYDILGRRTSLNDPDMGLSTYTYDAFSDLRTQTDAKLQTLTMEYDALGRLVKRTVPGSAGQSGGVSEWEYDTVNKGIGSLARVTGPSNYLKSYVYDQYGRLKEDVTTIKGQRYLQGYTYNNSGQLASRRYPNSGPSKKFEVFYNYRNGYLASITDRANGAAGCIEHWRADKYDALGRTERETLGKIVTTHRDYDGAKGVLKRIHSIINVGSVGDAQDLNYTYDAVNNLKTRSDALASSNETFSYDNLYRLTHHTKGGQTTRVDYDDIGNITYKSDVGTYQYTQTGGPHALSKVISAGRAFDPTNQFAVDWDWDGTEFTKALPKFNDVFDGEFTYDANGNITVSGNRRFEWTAFDKPRMMKTLGEKPTGLGLITLTQSTFKYDPDFNRIVKREQNSAAFGQYEETIYIGKEYERIQAKDGSLKHRYTISAGGNSIQIERQHGTTFDEPKYLLGDNLGSTNVIINALGQVEQRLEFDPWGMRLNTGDVTSVNSITNKGYTGHEMDDEIGVINMNARIYDPFLGRFLSADPVLPDAGDMQAYNRYAYVLNNPMKYTDPTGNFPIVFEVSVSLGGVESYRSLRGLLTFIAGIVEIQNLDFSGYGFEAFEGIEITPEMLAQATICIQAGPSCGGGDGEGGSEGREPGDGRNEGNGEDPNIDVDINIQPGDDKCNTPQCRVDRLNALVSADFPDLANPRVLAFPSRAIYGADGFTLGSVLSFVDPSVGDDTALRSLIFHERLHAEVNRIQGNPIGLTLGGGREERLIDGLEEDYQLYILSLGFTNPGRTSVPLPSLEPLRDFAREQEPNISTTNPPIFKFQ